LSCNSFEVTTGRQSRRRQRGKPQLRIYMKKLLPSHKTAMFLALQDDGVNKIAFAKHQ